MSQRTVRVSLMRSFSSRFRSLTLSVVAIVASSAVETVAIASEEALAAVPLPVDSSLETLTVNLLQNGHRMSVARLKTTASIEEVLAFYRVQWQEPLSDALPGHVENTSAPWSIISRPREGWNQVVQLRQTDDGVDARISVMELEASAEDLPTIALPSGGTLVSSTGGHDIGHDSSTWVVVSRAGVRSVADFYRRHFEDEGWSRVSDQRIKDARVMLLQREGERAELVVSRTAGGTMTVINKVIDES